jgi:hypothetical protein
VRRTDDRCDGLNLKSSGFGGALWRQPATHLVVIGPRSIRTAGFQTLRRGVVLLQLFRHDGSAQFTNRRLLTLMAKPIPRKVKSSEEPPWLMSGKGMPVTGRTPIIIPVLIAT